jgi:phosphatidyl-myo-inositol dimannoside synthase
VTRTLVVTNDFPPRVGGIQTFVGELVRRRPPESVVVLASTWSGASAFDAEQPYEVVRHHRSVLLPTPAVGRVAERLLREHRCDSVLFGAAAPLGLLARRLRDAGARRIVALTHGHEAGWAGMPGGSPLLRYIGDGVDVVTYLGAYTHARLAAALSPAAATHLARLTPGVDVDRFRPDVDGSAVRERHGLTGRPVVVCVSRLMPRKGQDTLVRALPEIRRRVPGAALLLVGGGPYRDDLVRLAAETDVADDVVLAGAVPRDELPAHYAAGDVFAMPCRTRNRGLDVEGLGIVFLEASATGLPVVAGRSGGAPDAVLPGRTGYVVDGRSVADVATRVATLLRDQDTAKTMGARGREWVEGSWGWDDAAARLGELLDPTRPLTGEVTPRG